MFCEKNNLQVLCTDPCHKAKTAAEKQLPKKDVMTPNQKYNDFKTYSLFNDIEDSELRNRNRAVV
jgi:hypothetical protein